MGDAGMSMQPRRPVFKAGIHYSDHSTLNTLQYCLPHGVPDPSQIWIIYIHGGAWRDPAIDASSFDKVQSLLLEDSCIAHVAGLASINYRLSPYPSHSSDPSNPADPARNAHHPDHINDVLAAILFLQDEYHFEDRYILVGHSCGATLALQVAMKRYWGKQYESSYATELNVVPPVAIVGVDGIYDIPALLETYRDEPAYLHFVTSAFGADKTVWHAVSPANADLSQSWQDGRLVSLVHSLDDELLDVDQRDRLEKALKKQDWTADGEKRIVIHDLHGLKHDELWQKPAELAKIIVQTVDTVAALLAA
ncbi:hypothetical protein AMS68_007865 [Peltaster fructicola]|uniref:Kynurenine formamidase n=1 Tax=Peltaster fructicola TaxID=286661 RepID=A0A6H0Y667_9PEZI|nr:hypothetical protein AMS68_007865 [Peltaster fructicola]